jgi:hypothetical protein
VHHGALKLLKQILVVFIVFRIISSPCRNIKFIVLTSNENKRRLLLELALPCKLIQRGSEKDVDTV